MEELKKLSRELNAEVHGLRKEVQEVDRRRKAGAVRTWLAIFVMAVALFFTGVTSYLVYDCTTPNGHCAQRGAEQTGKSVATINYSTIAAGWCVRVSPTEEEYLKCVQKKVPEYQERYSNK